MEDWEHADARRLAKRLAKYGNELLTFMWYDDVASDNNRKSSKGVRSLIGRVGEIVYTDDFPMAPEFLSCPAHSAPTLLAKSTMR